MGLIPGSGRSPGEGNGNPLQYSCLENPMDRGAGRATVLKAAKSQTRLSVSCTWWGRQTSCHSRSRRLTCLVLGGAWAGGRPFWERLCLFHLPPALACLLVFTDGRVLFLFCFLFLFLMKMRALSRSQTSSSKRLQAAHRRFRRQAGGHSTA